MNCQNNKTTQTAALRVLHVMEFQYKTVCLIMIACLSLHACATSPQSRYFTERRAVRNGGGILTTSSVATDYRCAVQCLGLHDCNSFNIGPSSDPTEDGLACELLKTDQNSLTSIVDQPQWTFFVGKQLIISY